jgi:hypothetical protein
MVCQQIWTASQMKQSPDQKLFPIWALSLTTFSDNGYIGS